MNIAEAAESVARKYIRNGMEPQAAIAKAVDEVVANAVSDGLGDFSSGWDAFTTYVPWIGGALAAWWLYSTGVKVKRAGSAYIDKKRRQVRAARAAYDAAS